MEDRLTDQPEEMIKTCPELGQLYECVTALENIQGVDNVSETEDKTSGDDGRQQRCEDFRQYRSDSLERILILFCSLLDCILGDTGYSGYFREVVVEL